jgi:hypothetical protein
MRTISKHKPSQLPRNDTESQCSYCGCTYYRSQLRRDRAGLLACARDYGGDIVTLSEANAAAAQHYPADRPVHDPGPHEPPDPVETPPVINWPDGTEPQF